MIDLLTFFIGLFMSPSCVVGIASFTDHCCFLDPCGVLVVFLVNVSFWKELVSALLLIFYVMRVLMG